MQVPFYKPDLPSWDLVQNDLAVMYRKGALYPADYSTEFEHRLRLHFSVRHALLVSSCSDGLILVLSDLPKSSRVIIPGYTFRSVYQALEWNGLQPVLCDVDENGQLDPQGVKDCFESMSNIKAVVNVHQFGTADYVDEFAELKQRYGFRLIYDGAHCFGTRWDDQPIGHLGDATVFSINVTKPLPCGEGGVVCTNNDDVARLVERARLFGQDKGRLDARQKGMNGKVQEFNSILGIYGLPRVSTTTELRHHIAYAYRTRLAKLPLHMPVINDRCYPSYSNFNIWVADKRDELVNYLMAAGIETRQYYPCIRWFQNFDGMLHKITMSEKLANTVISLPCYSLMTPNQTYYVTETIRKFYDR